MNRRALALTALMALAGSAALADGGRLAPDSASPSGTTLAGSSARLSSATLAATAASEAGPASPLTTTPAPAHDSGPAAVSASGTQGIAELTEAQTTYLERCGGCHGIQGHSAPGEVPSLRGQVSYFLCLPETRAYLIRLPSVASSPVPDDMLADLMNFVVFDLGGRPEARAAYGAYTASEVRELRKQPLNEVSLASYRAALVERLIDRCGAPSSLREYASARAQ